MLQDAGHARVGQQLGPGLWALDVELETQPDERAQKERIAHGPPLELHAVECGAGRLHLLVKDIGGALDETPTKFAAIRKKWRSKDWNRRDLLIHSFSF